VARRCAAPARRALPGDRASPRRPGRDDSAPAPERERTGRPRRHPRARARGLVRPLLPFAKARLVAHVAELGLPVHDDPAIATRATCAAGCVACFCRSSRSGWGRAPATTCCAPDGRRRASGAPGQRPRPPARSRTARRAAPHRSCPGGLARYDDVLSAALLRAAARRTGLVLGCVARVSWSSWRAARPGGGCRWRTVGWGRWRSIACASPARSTTPPSKSSRRVSGAVRCSASFAWPGRPIAPARLPRTDWTTWIVGANWEVRPPRPGDRLVPLGGIGRRPLRRMLMEARVPRSDRSGYPVVARGETILWVPGICRSAADLPRPGTRAVRVDVTKHREPQADGRA